MKIILDSNILIAALLRDSTVRKIIVEGDHEFLLPEVSLDEIRKHKDELVRKSRLSEEDFKAFLERLLQYVEIIPVEALRQFENEAKQIMKDIDPDDAPFIAAALAIEGSIIWSEDQHIKKQNKIISVNTRELILNYY